MSIAYVDTSAIASVVLKDDGWEAVAHTIASFSSLVSSNLLEAELRSACRRERLPFTDDLTRGISWVIPNRSLGSEFEMALDVGYVRGADLWHIATALYMPYDPPSVSFLSLDQQQRTVAAALGFQT